MLNFPFIVIVIIIIINCNTWAPVTLNVIIIVYDNNRNNNNNINDNNKIASFEIDKITYWLQLLLLLYQLVDLFVSDVICLPYTICQQQYNNFNFINTKYKKKPTTK